jgi:hypothetical protein
MADSKKLINFQIQTEIIRKRQVCVKISKTLQEVQQELVKEGLWKTFRKANEVLKELGWETAEQQEQLQKRKKKVG